MDLEAFRSAAPRPVPPGQPFRAQRVERTKRQRVAPYLRGPVPMAWLAAANAAGGSALALGLALWFQRAMRKRFGPILRVNNAVRKSIGLSADQSRRAVAALVSRGLIYVHVGGRGRCTEVELLDPPGSAPSVDRRKAAGDERRAAAGREPWRPPYDRPPSEQVDADAPTPDEGVEHE
jgi:hypothetical protein